MMGGGSEPKYLVILSFQVALKLRAYAPTTLNDANVALSDTIPKNIVSDAVKDPHGKRIDFQNWKGI